MLFLLYGSGHHPDLHSFPTRRSSDLLRFRPVLPTSARPRRLRLMRSRADGCSVQIPAFSRKTTTQISRSEEHTSELQSLRHLVCRLLLEKKKPNSRAKSHYSKHNTTP